MVEEKSRGRSNVEKPTLMPWQVPWSHIDLLVATMFPSIECSSILIDNILR